MVSIVLVLVVAVFIAAMGVLGLVAPTRAVAPFRIALDTPAARAEVRAVYGGFGVAIAALLVFAAVERGTLGDGIVLAVAVMLLGLAAGRAASRLVERQEAFSPIWTLLCVEVAFAALLIVAVAA